MFGIHRACVVLESTFSEMETHHPEKVLVIAGEPLLAVVLKIAARDAKPHVLTPHERRRITATTGE